MTPPLEPRNNDRPNAMKDLLQRVREATGPDRALDDDLTLALLGATKVVPAPYDGGISIALWPKASQPVQPYTACVTAALALVERGLPGWQRTLGEHVAPGNRGIMWKASLVSPQGGGMDSAFAPTPALALICALLVAKGEEK
jgi:hypothetical protein